MPILTEVVVSGVSSPAAETAILTTPVIGTAPLTPVHISGSVDVTEGTTGTAYVLRVRQGNGVAGPVVGQADTAADAAGASGLGGFSFDDLSNYLSQAGGGQYTLTIAQTGATAPGTVNAELTVEV